MTKTIVKGLLAIFIAVSALASCTSDEPVDKQLSGEEFVKHLDSVLSNLSGQMLEANESGNSYYLLTQEKADAYNACESLLTTKWDGTDKTYKVPDNFGNIRVMDGTVNGLHCTIAFSVKGLKLSTLQLCTYEYADNNKNGDPVRAGYECFSCRKKKIIPVYNKEKKCMVCPSCGSSKLGMLIKFI